MLNKRRVYSETSYDLFIIFIIINVLIACSFIYFLLKYNDILVSSIRLIILRAKTFHNKPIEFEGHY